MNHFFSSNPNLTPLLYLLHFTKSGCFSRSAFSKGFQEKEAFKKMKKADPVVIKSFRVKMKVKLAVLGFEGLF